MKTLILGCFALLAAALAAGPTQARPLLIRQYVFHYNSGTQRTAADIASEKETLAGDTALRAGDYVTAEADYRASIAGYDAIGYGMATKNAYYGLAVALTGEGRYAEALRAYHVLFYDLPIQNCVGCDTPSVAAAYHRQFVQALYADPIRYGGFGSDTPDAAMRYALLLEQAGQWTDAIKFYEGALPYLPNMRVHLGVHFSPVVPQDIAFQSAAHIALGMFADFGYGSFGRGDDYSRAMSEFSQAQQLQPDSPLANYYYGLGLQKMGRTEQAQAAFAKTLKIGHGSVKVAARKALTKMKRPT